MRELVDAVAETVSGNGVESAPAKINLALHVLGRRPDGYHRIDSLVVFAEFADVVRVVKSANGHPGLTVDGAFGDELELVSRPYGNLVMRAAELLSNTVQQGRSPPVQLVLTKQIPIAAGLGGGSADAAAALRLLNRHWSLGLDGDSLAKIGFRLGADVPMCVASRPVIARGIGERLTPATGLPRLPILLVNPGIPLSTASVYHHLDQREGSPLPPLPEKFSSVVAFVIWLRQTRNDLRKPAKAVTGLAERAVKALSADPDCLFAQMTGSGPTAFGIFPKLSTAERAAERIRQERPNWWVEVTETIGS